MEKIKLSFHYYDDEINEKAKVSFNTHTVEDGTVADLIVEKCQDFLKCVGYCDEFAYSIQNINWNSLAFKPDWDGRYLVTLNNKEVDVDRWQDNKFEKYNISQIKAWAELPWGYGER